jgi:Ca2+-binding RTX toxin-like protein
MLRRSLIVTGAFALVLFVPGAGVSAGTRCLIKGTDGDDRIVGTPRHDRICGRRGEDVIKSKGGDDRIYGDANGDKLKGGIGRDLVVGGSGDDVLDGMGHIDVVRGGDGNDRLYGGGWRDSLGGGGGDDFIDAVDQTDSKDTLRGGQGHDVCRLESDDEARGCEVEHVVT